MRIEARDSLKLNNRVENKRHTNARQPLASYSATGATIPPSPPVPINCIWLRDLSRDTPSSLASFLRTSGCTAVATGKSVRTPLDDAACLDDQSLPSRRKQHEHFSARNFFWRFHGETCFRASRSRLIGALQVIEESHETKIHVQLLVAVEERQARIVSHEFDFRFLVAA